MAEAISPSVSVFHFGCPVFSFFVFIRRRTSPTYIGIIRITYGLELIGSVQSAAGCIRTFSTGINWIMGRSLITVCSRYSPSLRHPVSYSQHW